MLVGLASTSYRIGVHSFTIGDINVMQNGSESFRVSSVYLSRVIVVRIEYIHLPRCRGTLLQRTLALLWPVRNEKD